MSSHDSLTTTTQLQSQAATAARRTAGGTQSGVLPRVGQISFVNCLPIVLPMQRGLVKMSADVHFDTPSQLNRLYAENALDVSAMSSFYYLSRNDLQLIPYLSIACTGAVGSVLLFTRRPLEELKSGRFLGSAQSATSVNLLKVLCQVHYGWIPQIVPELKPDLQDVHADAALVIGDRALEVDSQWSKSYHRIDLGKWWMDTHALPMVFGVWAANSPWVTDHRANFENICADHLRARDIGLNSFFEDVLAEAVKRTGLSQQRLHDYYRQELDFRLTPDHIAGLQLYRKLCLQFGLL